MSTFRHVEPRRPVADNSGRSRRSNGGFTLIEILIIVVILGILAAVVVPQFSDASERSATNGASRQLQMLRGQIELFRNQEGRDPDLIGQQWAELLAGDYLANPPRNPNNSSLTVAGAAGPGVGWVWRDKGNGTLVLYATDQTSLVETAD
jgi:prepilin-type N-terminal cleavage/methylation domain-containing protein